MFNYSNCLCNKNIIEKIYGKHFKTIIFYSDYPMIGNDDDGVNFLNITRGFYTHKIFNHFNKKYSSIIDDSDGVFYTMDDNIINVNILNLLDCEKIIYYKPNTIENDDMGSILNGITTDHSWFKLDDIENHSGWLWTGLDCGKNAIKKLLNDKDFKNFNIDKFSASFSDWFYLPKKYLTDDLFKLFGLFSDYEVFLEMAISTTIHSIEKDESKYQSFTCDLLYNGRDNFFNKDYIFNSLNRRHNLILHPIKFNQNPNSKEWLKEILCKDKCILIITINKPNETILKHINNNECDVIIVGDTETPDDYKNLNCIFLDIASQKKLFPESGKSLLCNNYDKKNLGYIYALKKGYNKIYETDDDYNILNDIMLNQYQN